VLAIGDQGDAGFINVEVRLFDVGISGVDVFGARASGSW